MDLPDYAKFKAQKRVTYLYKLFLERLEALEEDNIISEELFEELRFFTLNKGNACIRRIHQDVDNYKEFEDFEPRDH